MQRLGRYVFWEIIWLYIFGVAAFCLLLSIDMLTSWANFLLRYEATLNQVMRLMLYRLPYFLHLSLPVAVVFAILLATGRLAKDSELKAAYSLGVPPLKLMVPVLTVGLLASLLAVVNNGFLEPIAEQRYQVLVDSFFYARPPAEVQLNVAYRAGERVFFAGRIRANEEDSTSAFLSGVTVIERDGSVITAPAGMWQSSREAQVWELYEAEQTLAGASPEFIGTMTVPFVLESTVSETLVRGEGLTLGELWRRLTQLRQVGSDTRQLAFTFHTRLADAFSALIFALIAGALGLYLHNRSAGFAWTIVLIVVFWATWTVANDLFEQRVLTAELAAWLTPLLIGGLGSLIAWRRLR